MGPGRCCAATWARAMLREEVDPMFPGRADLGAPDALREGDPRRRDRGHGQSALADQTGVPRVLKDPKPPDLLGIATEAPIAEIQAEEIHVVRAGIPIGTFTAEAAWANCWNISRMYPLSYG